MLRRQTVVLSALFALAVAGCDDDDIGGPEPSVRSEEVKASGDIAGALTQFRGLLGEPANGADPGPLAAGRREIKWDGVPADLTNNNAFPLDAFRRNGLLYRNLGSGLRVSDNDFADIDPSYAEQFNSFSAPKTFVPIGSDQSEVTFVVPGSDTPARVTGFGVIFSDVDRDGAASIQVYAADGKSLGIHLAPVRSDANGHSFIGVVFEEAIIARVVITSGQAPLAAGVRDLSDGGTSDLVVFDDLLFGEPQAQ